MTTPEYEFIIYYINYNITLIIILYNNDCYIIIIIFIYLFFIHFFINITFLLSLSLIFFERKCTRPLPACTSTLLRGNSTSPLVSCQDDLQDFQTLSSAPNLENPFSQLFVERAQLSRNFVCALCVAQTVLKYVQHQIQKKKRKRRCNNPLADDGANTQRWAAGHSEASDPLQKKMSE